VSGKTSERIIDCLQQGLVTSATVMANMPDFERAAAHAQGLGLERQIGVHPNFDAGPAVSVIQGIASGLVDTAGL